MQNLRARPYDPANGRFIGLDPFAGNMQDPQSLHKYAYVHGDPANATDPTGLFAAKTQMTTMSIKAFGFTLRVSRPVGIGIISSLGFVAAAALTWGLYKLARKYDLVSPFSTWNQPPAERDAYSETINIRTTLVRISRPIGQPPSGPSVAKMDEFISKSNDFWGGYGIKMNVVNDIVADHPAYWNLASDEVGRGEIQEAINHYQALYPGTLIIIATGNLTELDGRIGGTRGQTNNELDGFAITEQDAWITVAHELAHVLIGGFHLPANGDIANRQHVLVQGLSEIVNRGVDDQFVDRAGVETARNNARQYQ